MVGFPWSFALSLLALACSALALAFSYLKSPPARALKMLRDAEVQSKAHLDAALRLETQWKTEVDLTTAARNAWAVEFAGIAERCDETLDRAESKRRRVAATESRRNGQPAPVEMTREQIIEAARMRTLGAR